MFSLQQLYSSYGSPKLCSGRWPGSWSSHLHWKQWYSKWPLTSGNISNFSDYDPFTSGEFGLTVNELWPAEGNTALRLCRLSFWCRVTGPVVGTGCHLERQLRFLPFFGLTRLTQTFFFSLAIGLAGMVQDLHKDALVCWRVGHPLIRNVVKHQVKFWCILKREKDKDRKILSALNNVVMNLTWQFRLKFHLICIRV